MRYQFNSPLRGPITGLGAELTGNPPNRGSEATPIPFKFWHRIVKDPAPDGCWRRHLVQGARYSMLKHKGRVLLAHRVSWELHFGAIPEGMVVAHRCNVGACVRPDHLYIATPEQNSTDAQRDGLYPTGLRNGTHTKPESRRKGESNGYSKLTQEIVLQIRADAAWGDSYPKIAARFGVHRESVGRVVRRELWRHVP